MQYVKKYIKEELVVGWVAPIMVSIQNLTHMLPGLQVYTHLASFFSDFYEK